MHPQMKPFATVLHGVIKDLLIMISTRVLSWTVYISGIVAANGALIKSV